MVLHSDESKAGIRGFNFSRTQQIVTQVEIPRPPEEVWPYLVDWERLSDWMIEASDIEVVSGQREGVGVEAEATVRIGFIKTRDRVRVSQWQPPAVLEIQHLGWVKGSGYMELSPTEEGSLLFWRETLTAPLGFLGAIGLKFFLPLMRRTFRRDARVLRAIAEAEAH